MRYICNPDLVACAVGIPLAAGSAVRAEGGSARKASELKRAPFGDAATIGTLASGDKVDILKKRGGWYMVKSGSRNGWVRMLSIQRRQARKGGMLPGWPHWPADGRAPGGWWRLPAFAVSARRN